MVDYARNVTPESSTTWPTARSCASATTMLLQELRVVLPGVQVLMAFLLTAPFAQRFDDLDDPGGGRTSSPLSALSDRRSACSPPRCFTAWPNGPARRARLVWSVRLAVAGIVLLALALTAATWCITRLVFGTTAATVVAVCAVAAFVVVWVVLPLSVGRSSDAA